MPRSESFPVVDRLIENILTVWSLLEINSRGSSSRLVLFRFRLIESEELMTELAEVIAVSGDPRKCGAR